MDWSGPSLNILYIKYIYSIYMKYSFFHWDKWGYIYLCKNMSIIILMYNSLYSCCYFGLHLPKSFLATFMVLILSLHKESNISCVRTVICLGALEMKSWKWKLEVSWCCCYLLSYCAGLDASAPTSSQELAIPNDVSLTPFCVLHWHCKSHWRCQTIHFWKHCLWQYLLWLLKTFRNTWWMLITKKIKIKRGQKMLVNGCNDYNDLWTLLYSSYILHCNIDTFFILNLKEFS